MGNIVELDNIEGTPLLLCWVTETLDETPTEFVMSEIKEILLENAEEIAEAMSTTGGITIFANIEEWFVSISVVVVDFNKVIIKHFSQDEWLDKISEHEKKKTKSGWRN